MDKKCNKCFSVKSFSDFYVNVSLAHGHNYTCKECEKAYQIKYKEKRRLDKEFRQAENIRDLKRYHEKKYNVTRKNPTNKD